MQHVSAVPVDVFRRILGLLSWKETVAIQQYMTWQDIKRKIEASRGDVVET